MGEIADYQLEQLGIPWDGYGYSPADQLCLTCKNYSKKSGCKFYIYIDPDALYCQMRKEK